MVVAVALALHQKLVVVPRQEHDGVQRLYIFLACLAVNLFALFSAQCVVGNQAAVVLVAVQLEHIDALAVGRPCDVGEIAVGRVAGIQIDDVFRGRVVDAHRHLVRCLTCHRVFVGLACGFAREDVDLRVVGHHRLVHAIERQPLAVGTPEESFRDAELVAVNALPVNNLARVVGGELLGFFTVADIELMPFHGCQMSGSGTKILGLHVVAVEGAQECLALPIHEHDLSPVDQLCDGLLGVGKLDVVEMAHTVVLVALNNVVHLVERKQRLFGAAFRVDKIAGIQVLPDELVAPPCIVAVFRHHVTIVPTSVVQVFKCERFFLLCHKVCA